MGDKLYKPCRKEKTCGDETPNTAKSMGKTWDAYLEGKRGRRDAL